MEKHFVGKVAQKVVIKHGEKILISRDIQEEKWDIPGGRLNAEESPKEGLLREVREELGIDIEIGSPFYIDIFLLSRDREPHLLVCYEATFEDPSLVTIARDEIAEVRWITKDEVNSVPMWDEYKKALQKYFEIQ